MKYFSCIILLAMLLVSCEERQIPTPKPKGYFRIDLPIHDYQSFCDTAPFMFEYPKYAVVEQDTDANTEPFWYNINFPQFNATIHLSYKNVENNIIQYLEDSRTLVYKHTIKADAIDETIKDDTINNVFGIIYNIKGNAASSVQFAITDSAKHFVRGALYFNNVPNKDSIEPVLNFVSDDINHLLESFKWN